MPRTPNDALRAAREATPSPYVPDACMSRAELAEAVNRWCAEHGHRPGALDEHRIGRMEQGKTLWPNVDYRAGFRAILGCTDAELGFRPSQRTPVRPIDTTAELQWQPDTFSITSDTSAAAVAASQREWLRVRQAPGVRGRELTELAAWLYPESHRAPGGHVLAAPGWLLDEPVPLENVLLEWSETRPAGAQHGSVDHVLPLTAHGERYAGYSRAVRDLVRPRLLENRLSYRLLNIEHGDNPSLSYGTTTFFEVFDFKQAIAHEFKAAWLAANRSLPSWDALPLRASLSDTFDPSHVLMAPGVNTLTIRRDRSGKDHRFVLHERDGGKVADGGGLCHVMPAGEFQPSSVAAADIENDFSLWRNIMREFSEEFLGNPEHDGSGTRSINYTEDEPFRSMELARAEGSLHVWYCGLILEPLELGAATLTVAVIDDVVFDRMFANLVSTNDEGYVVRSRGRADMPFTCEAINRLDTRLSASALTLLCFTWQHRSMLGLN